MGITEIGSEEFLFADGGVTGGVEITEISSFFASRGVEEVFLTLS